MIQWASFICKEVGKWLVGDSGPNQPEYGIWMILGFLTVSGLRHFHTSIHWYESGVCLFGAVVARWVGLRDYVSKGCLLTITQVLIILIKIELFIIGIMDIGYWLVENRLNTCISCSWLISHEIWLIYLHFREILLGLCCMSYLIILKWMFVVQFIKFHDLCI